MPDTATAPRDGIVFAVTGAGYVDICADAAESVRAVMHDTPIDIFCDVPPDRGPFDMVHILDGTGPRPKFEALRRSRFERTLYLDADIRMVADVSDVFQILDRFEIALAHNQHRNPDNRGIRNWTYPIPNAFPELNTGVIGMRKTDGTVALMDRIDTVFRAEGLKVDQPAFREMIYESGLALAVLPPEYNMMAVREFEAWDHSHAAPRIIHRNEFHRHIGGDQHRYRTLDSALGPVARAHLERLLAADKTLNPDSTAQTDRLIDHGPLGLMTYVWALLWKRLAQRRERRAATRN